MRSCITSEIAFHTLHKKNAPFVRFVHGGEQFIVSITSDKCTTFSIHDSKIGDVLQTRSFEPAIENNTLFHFAYYDCAIYFIHQLKIIGWHTKPDVIQEINLPTLLLDNSGITCVSDSYILVHTHSQWDPWRGHFVWLSRTDDTQTCIRIPIDDKFAEVSQREHSLAVDEMNHLVYFVRPFKNNNIYTLEIPKSISRTRSTHHSVCTPTQITSICKHLHKTEYKRRFILLGMAGPKHLAFVNCTRVESQTRLWLLNLATKRGIILSHRFQRVLAIWREKKELIVIGMKKGRLKIQHRVLRRKKSGALSSLHSTAVTSIPLPPVVTQGFNRCKVTTLNISLQDGRSYSCSMYGVTLHAVDAKNWFLTGKSSTLNSLCNLVHREWKKAELHESTSLLVVNASVSFGHQKSHSYPPAYRFPLSLDEVLHWIDGNNDDNPVRARNLPKLSYPQKITWKFTGFTLHIGIVKCAIPIIDLCIYVSDRVQPRVVFLKGTERNEKE